MKKTLEPTLENLLSLFSKRLGEFKGESLRGYRKAYSSFQVYLISNYPLSHKIDENVVENWVCDNIIHGLKSTTLNFYLDKVAALYSGVGHRFAGGKFPIFKNVKKRLKELNLRDGYAQLINGSIERSRKSIQDSDISDDMAWTPDEFLKYIDKGGSSADQAYIWGCIALGGGVRPDIVKAILGEVPEQLNFLGLCGAASIDEDERKEVAKIITKSLFGEESQWFALRLRPGVKYEDLILRFTRLNYQIKMPELFYPCEEIARRIGRKVVWKGRPVIRDVVFFKNRRSEIYPMLTRIYDLAWCYRSPGNKPGNYSAIPARAMEDFREAIGILGPEFEVAPTGELNFNPGDEVVVVNGRDSGERGRILKKPTIDEDGNKIYRVVLLDRNTRWEIGVDARLLKK
ncbi:MAG: hypothetical protein J1D77_03155 [Muribaculaceae bacterium]|nr:hypothetical protein [Muribaculaceae bacterium]